MGKNVNVVLWDGSVVSMPEDDAAKLQQSGTGSLETRGEEVARGQAGEDAAEEDNILDRANALAAGFDDTATFGGYGKLVEALGSDNDVEQMRAEAQAHPYLRMAGELGAMVAPTGLLGDTVAAGSALTGPGLAMQAGEALGGGTVGRLVEGAALGLGSHIADTNITGDPLTVEGVVTSAGMGAILNFGTGLLADKLIGRGAAAVAEANNPATDARLAIEGGKAFSSETPSLGEFRDAYEANQANIQKEYKVAQAARDKYTAWLQPKSIQSAIDTADAAKLELQTRILNTKYGQEATAARDAAQAAQEQFAEESEKANKLVNSTEKWPSVMKGVDSAIDEVRSRYAPIQSDTLFKPKLQGYEGEVVDGRFDRGDAYYTATKKPPISPELDAELKDYSQRASIVRQMRQGGYKLNAGKWIESPGAPPDPMGALRELHALRDDFTNHFGGVKFPDLPALPTPPPNFELPKMAGDLTELKQLSQATRDIEAATNSARAKFRTGDYEGAAADLRSLPQRAANSGINDLVLPKVPDSAPAVDAPPKAPKAPKSLREFGRMHADTVAKIANSLDPTSAAAFQKVAADLGFDTEGNPAELVAGVHRKLGDYLGAIDRIKAAAATKAARSKNPSTILDYLRGVTKHGARSAAGYAAWHASGGHLLGVAAGGAARKLASVVMDTMEDSVLGGALLSAKDGIRETVNTTMESAGQGLKALAGPTTFLSVSFPSGKPDPETDLRKRALNRINDIIGAAQIAPDSAFTAMQPTLGHPSNIGVKVSMQIQRTLGYLASTLPRDPGLNTKMFKSQWLPTTAQAIELSHRMEAAFSPLTAIARFVQGDGHPAAAETLRACYPATMQEVANAIATNSDTLQNVPTRVAASIGRLLGTPMTGFQNPSVMLALQAPDMQNAANQMQSVRPPRNSLNAPGRPPAVQSELAGSSVSALIS